MVEEKNGLSRKRDSLTEDQMKMIEANRNAAIERRNAKRQKLSSESYEGKEEDTTFIQAVGANVKRDSAFTNSYSLELKKLDKHSLTETTGDLAPNIGSTNEEEKGQNGTNWDSRLKGPDNIVSSKTAKEKPKTAESNSEMNVSKPHKRTNDSMPQSSRKAFVQQCLSEAKSANRPRDVQKGQQVVNVSKRKPDTLYSFGALVKRTCSDKLT